MNPLDQLADIQLPQDVNIWPLAWGWWLSGILLILLISSIVYVARNYVLKRRARKAALLALENIDLQQDKAVSQINIILKRAALSYFPQEQVAALHGAQWSAFLNNQLSKKHQHKYQQKIQQFVESLYQDTQPKDAVQGIEIAQIWLKSALPPSQKHNQHAPIQEVADA